MKSFLTLTLIFLASNCFADFGPCYYIEAKVTFLDSTSTSAYFSVGDYKFLIRHYEGRHEYKSNGDWKELPHLRHDEFRTELTYDSAFSWHLLTLKQNSARYFTDIQTLTFKPRRYTVQVIRPIGKPFKLNIDSISKVFVSNIYLCDPYYFISTRLSTSDKSWINTPTKLVNLGGGEICGYTALYYDIATSESKQPILDFQNTLECLNESRINPKEYSDDFQKTMYEEVNRLTRVLKSMFILVVRYCST
ncbi:hypothetical protein [Reichenbachiella versicolor]|uniref:hypothetical protein n=1 Tax=Reichenbachiella versicolor TaxID=1821036 RepID=UPI000D6E59A0|nr:hypothetical protein [Reichenbachiella versicolor]